MKQPGNKSGELVSLAYAAWLSAMMLIQFVFNGDLNSIVIGFALGALPAGLHLWLLGARRGNDPLGAILFIPFISIIFASLLFNTSRFTLDVAMQTMGFIFAACVGYMIAQQSKNRLLERIFVWYAILLSAVLIIVLLDGDRLWGRLMGRLHPNLWAAVALAAIPGALALSNRIAAIAITAFIVYMIGFEFNARGPLLYAIMMVLTYIFVWSAHRPSIAFSPRFQLAAIAMVIASVAALSMNWEFLRYEVLMFDSASRGIASGLSGRVELWTFLINIAADHPFIGVGFRMHDTYLVQPGVYSAHNAYIAMLVDLGVVGLLLYLTMVLSSLWRSAIRPNHEIAATYILGYALLGMTEARAINVGNPASLLFILTVAATLSNRRPGTPRGGVTNAVPELRQPKTDGPLTP